jgi:hypothetical protein
MKPIVVASGAIYGPSVDVEIGTSYPLVVMIGVVVGSNAVVGISYVERVISWRVVNPITGSWYLVSSKFFISFAGGSSVLAGLLIGTS